MILLQECVDGQLSLLVVCINQILQDGSRLSEGDAGVGVFDGRNAAVGIDGNVRLLFNLGHGNESLSTQSVSGRTAVEQATHVLVRHSKLFQDHNDLPRVGAAVISVDDDLFQVTRYVIGHDRVCEHCDLTLYS